MTTPPKQPRNYSKAAFILAVGAFLVSAGNAAAPAIAQAIASNSDRVDGFHAVKAGTGVKARKGKLVATSPTTGLLPNNIIKKAHDSFRLDGKLGVDYQTDAEAEARRDRVIRVPLGNFSPPTSALTVVTGQVDIPAAGRVRVSTSLVTNMKCAVGGTAIAWLTIDDVFVPGALASFPAGDTEMWAITLDGLTDAVVTAGNHTVRVRSGCQTGDAGAATSYLPHSLMVTVLGSTP